MDQRESVEWGVKYWQTMKCIVGCTKDLRICYLNSEKLTKVLGNRETWSDLHLEKLILTAEQIGEDKSRCKETLKEAVSVNSLDYDAADVKRMEKLK